ncbi:MAG TPA: hypothetical protein VNO75_12220 [Gemmatimonadaceae bacterium]|nr:hypothetical protein [Gemmatimonadaceae bacterium]
MAGVAIVALWIAGLAMMLRRNASRSEEQQLAEVALTVQPATFYYVVERDGQRVGAASSAIDTTVRNLVSEEYFVGDFPSPSGAGVERTSARWQSALSRGFRLQRTSIDIVRAAQPFRIRTIVTDDTALVTTVTRPGGPSRSANLTAIPPVFTPALAPVAFMLGGSHEIGRTQTMSVFDPVSRTVLRPELRIHAESLFTVIDSADVDAAGNWAPAHRDTVRAWRIEGAPAGISAWVDAEGRIVAAKMAGGLSVMRTAFELAFRDSQKK